MVKYASKYFPPINSGHPSELVLYRGGICRTLADMIDQVVLGRCHSLQKHAKVDVAASRNCNIPILRRSGAKKLKSSYLQAFLLFPPTFSLTSGKRDYVSHLTKIWKEQSINTFKIRKNAKPCQAVSFLFKSTPPYCTGVAQRQKATRYQLTSP